MSENTYSAPTARNTHEGRVAVVTGAARGLGAAIANSRGPESLASVVSALGEGVSAATLDEAASAGIVVIAVPWDRVPEALQGLNWNSQIVIDATNDWVADDLRGRTSSELLADGRGSHPQSAASHVGSIRLRPLVERASLP
jgi:predicted dinucleotide-binding enzyme